MTVDEARTLARRILEDMADGHSRDRYRARRLRECLAALEAECFSLAAGVCEHRLGNEHGNAYCGVTGKLL